MSCSKLKKIISTVMLMVLMVNILPSIRVFADSTSGSCGDGVNYSFDESTGTLTISGKGDMYEYISCEEEDLSYGIRFCDGPWTTTETYDLCKSSTYAPWISYGIKSVIVKNGVTGIGYGAFANCKDLTSVIIENGVTKIDGRAFVNCENLTSIALPNSLTKIGDRAFDNCKRLTSIHIPDSVTEIDNFAFCYCTRLTSIFIPYGVTSIGSGAFSHCYSLTSIMIDENNTKYKFIDGVLFSKDGTYLHTYLVSNKAPSYTVPDGVTSIGDWAFDSCKNLTSLFTNNVTNIGEKAFCRCENLVTYSFDSSTGTLTISGKGSVDFCPHKKSVKSVVIGEGITSIGSSAFRETSLTSITIPASVTNIGDYVFMGCNKLNTVIYLGVTEPINDDLVFAHAPKSIEIILSSNYEGTSFCGIKVKRIHDSNCQIA